MADEKAQVIARALFDHDSRGSVDGEHHREAMWLMHYSAYMSRAVAVMAVLDARADDEHRECAALLEAAGDEIERLRSTPPGGGDRG